MHIGCRDAGGPAPGILLAPQCHRPWSAAHDARLRADAVSTVCRCTAYGAGAADMLQGCCAAARASPTTCRHSPQPQQFQTLPMLTAPRPSLPASLPQHGRGRRPLQPGAAQPLPVGRRALQCSGAGPAGQPHLCAECQRNAGGLGSSGGLLWLGAAPAPALAAAGVAPAALADGHAAASACAGGKGPAAEEQRDGGKCAGSGGWHLQR